MSVSRLLIAADYLEEGWPSMDLAAEMLERHWPAAGPGSSIAPSFLRPRLPRPFRRLPWLGASRGAVNAERFLGRFVAYPRELRAKAAAYSLFHVADHSYAHLALELPPDRVGVYCFDLDAFRCLFGKPRRTAPHLRAMARRTLRGLERASVVFYSTEPVRNEIVQRGLLDPRRLVYAPLGVAPEFGPEADDVAARKLGSALDGPYVLHVGACIARKRIDVLIETFAALRHRFPELRLIKVGGPWSQEQRDLLAKHEVESAVTQLAGLSRQELAEVYRRARLCLLPSEAEGFGLPVVEALACGVPVLASDIPVLREVGGDVVRYLPVGDVAAWAAAASDWLSHPELSPPREALLARASVFSWPRYADVIARAYAALNDQLR